MDDAAKEPVAKDPVVKLCEHCMVNPATEPHSCPYAEDVGNDPDPEYCTCCPDCEHNCLMDI